MTVTAAEQVSLLLTLGMISGLRSLRKSKLFTLFTDNQSCRPPTEQRRGACPTEERLSTADAPLFNSTLPLCGLKWYLLHRDRPVIQTGEPAGCGEEGWTVATPAGLQLHSPPVGKIRQKTSRLKAATLECFCV